MTTVAAGPAASSLLCKYCKNRSSRRLEQFYAEGDQLCLWYLDRPEQQTWYSDPKIAGELGFLYRGRPNEGRVRELRREIDKCSCHFDGFAFGPKRNGPGRHLSRLNVRDDTSGNDPLRGQLGEIAGRINQSDDQHRSEQERTIAALLDAQETARLTGDFDLYGWTVRALADEDNHKRLMPATLAEARRLGISIPRGVA